MWPFSEISTKTRWTACFFSCPMCVRILLQEAHSSYQEHRLKSTTQQVICPNLLQSHQNRAILTFWCGSFKTIKRWWLTLWEMGPQPHMSDCFGHHFGNAARQVHEKCWAGEKSAESDAGEKLARLKLIWQKWPLRRERFCDNMIAVPWFIVLLSLVSK